MSHEMPTLLRQHWPTTRADPPTSLLPDTYAARLYSALAPLAQQDEATGWSLLVYVNALGSMFQLVEDLVRDTPEGVGWSALLDLDRCPDEALPWLGQFAGVRVLQGSTPDQMRQRIASTDGFKRGTPAAMRGAAQATLTPPGTVVFRERDGDPYFLSVVTYTAQTPDQAATLAALVAQKPAGIVLTYTVHAGQDYTQLRTNHATYANVKASYATYDAVRNDTPA